MLAITSSRDMPMPLSETVRVRASLSIRSVIFSSGLALVQRGVRERFEPQLVGGVRAVRDQLPEENLLVAVQGVDHQREQLLDLGLESERLAGGGLDHAKLPFFS
jgi:hypothetical protein